MASSLLSSGLPLNLAVVERLVLTLLFLPVAGLARTWDLRTYTGTLLALVTGRGCAYSYAYVEQFLSRLAHAGADERLTDAVAQWTWALWHAQRAKPEQEQEEQQAVFYVDGHRKAVYSDVLVPRGPVGKLGGKILGGPGISGAALPAGSSEAFHYPFKPPPSYPWCPLPFSALSN